MSNIVVNRKNHDEARKYFGVLGNREYDLHHVDTELIKTNPERYNEWRPEDLIVLTHSEHSKLHYKDKNSNFGRAPKGERNGANTRPEKNNFINNNPGTKMKGMKWFNNGIEQIRAFECPEGFVHGMLK